jgi:hypothetical protein
MEKYATAEGLVQAFLNPYVAQLMHSQGLELGPFSPEMGYHLWRNEQAFQAAQQQAIQAAATGDTTPIRIMKGLYAMLGKRYEPPQTAQQEEMLNKMYATAAPFLMALAPKLFDELHGGVGSQASLVSAIMASHRYDQMQAPEAAQLASEVSKLLLQNPAVNMRGFKLSEIGEIYRQAVQRGYVQRGMSPQEIAVAITPIIGTVSAVRDGLAAEGTYNADFNSMFNTIDSLMSSQPGLAYSDPNTPALPGQVQGGPHARTWGELENQLRMGTSLTQRGGVMKNIIQPGMMGPGTPPLSQLEQQNAQLTAQARRSPVGAQLAIMAGMADQGIIRPNTPAAQLLQQIQADPLSVDPAMMDEGNWAEVMARSGVPKKVLFENLHTQLQANRYGQLGMYGQYLTPELSGSLRAMQAKIDHPQIQRLLAKINAGNPATAKQRLNQSVLESRANHLLMQRGYGNLAQYRALQSPKVTGRLQNLYTQLRGEAGQARGTSHMGHKGPLERVMDEIARSSNNEPANLPQIIGSVFGGMRERPFPPAASLPKPPVAQPAAQPQPYGPQPMQPQPPEPPELPEPLKPKGPLKMAAEKCSAEQKAEAGKPDRPFPLKKPLA